MYENVQPGTVCDNAIVRPLPLSAERSYDFFLVSQGINDL